MIETQYPGSPTDPALNLTYFVGVPEGIRTPVAAVKDRIGPKPAQIDTNRYTSKAIEMKVINGEKPNRPKPART